MPIRRVAVRVIDPRRMGIKRNVEADLDPVPAGGQAAVMADVNFGQFAHLPPDLALSLIHI